MLRCVITGHQDDKSAFMIDGSAPEVVTFSKTPGMEVSKIWGTSRAARIGENAIASGGVGASFIPGAGETRFYLLKIPPDSVTRQPGFDIAAAAQEFAERLPEMAAVREAQDPAMHRTDTVDYLIVLDGEIWLELDDREEVRLRQHDVIVQNGTRHAWRNKSDQTATIAVVMVGGDRRA